MNSNMYYYVSLIAYAYHRRANDTRTQITDPVKQLKVQVTY